VQQRAHRQGRKPDHTRDDCVFSGHRDSSSGEIPTNTRKFNEARGGKRRQSKLQRRLSSSRSKKAKATRRLRKAGMERKELLGINGKIFVEQGQAIAKHAASDIRVLVVGNPCNTNCLIAMNNAREVPSDRWFAMTRLDENRAKTQLALKSGSHWREVTNVAIWGNHSSTLFPDFFNARIGGKPANEVISDREWLETTFIKTVQQRGAAIIQARGLSSAKSAAHGAVESVKSITEATPGEDWHSVALCSDGSYGVEKGLICSFPTRSDGSKVSIVQNLPLNDFAKAKIEASVNELKEERAMVAELLPR
jgi:malate dehydrogenase